MEVLNTSLDVTNSFGIISSKKVVCCRWQTLATQLTNAEILLSLLLDKITKFEASHNPFSQDAFFWLKKNRKHGFTLSVTPSHKS